MNKSILKQSYYYEEYPIYDTLPDELEPLEYTEQIFTEGITHKKILETLKPTIHTVEDAFRVAMTYINSSKKDYRIIYFTYKKKSCRLGVWRDDDGEVGVDVYVDEVLPGGEFGSGDGVLSSNKSSVPEMVDSVALRPSDAYTNIIEWLYLNSGNQMSNEFKKQLLDKLKDLMIG